MQHSVLLSNWWVPLAFVFVITTSVQGAHAQSGALTSLASHPNREQDQSQRLLSETLKQLEAERGVRFFYDAALIDQQQVTYVVNKQASLNEVLENLLAQHGLWAKKLRDDYYVIKARSTERPIQLLSQPLQQDTTASPPRTDWVGASELRQPPEIVITGQVTDLSTNEALPGVNVVVKGTTVGTVTDLKGNYRLTVPDKAITLVFSSVGFVREEVTIGNQTVVNLAMPPDIQSLQEVVVVGYGTQQRKDITGALSSVKAEEIEKIVTPSVDQALPGRTPGLFVANPTGGAPGAAPTVRIRGSNSLNSANEPLYVIDGFPVYPNNGQVRGNGDFRTDQLSENTSNVLATINPNDIASIEVLKDASATAIYGARGANGVIVITTKRGSSRRPGLDFDYYSGVSRVTRKFPLLNAAQYAGLLNEYNAAFDVAPAFTEEEIREFERTGGTDWQDEVYRNAWVHNFQLSSSGGNENTQHYLAANYYNEDGIIIGNNLQRFSLRANLDTSPTRKLKLGNSFTTSYTLEEAVPTGDRNPATGPGVIFSVTDYPPTDPVYDEYGDFVLFPSRGGSAITNPVAIAKTQDITYKSLRSLGTFFVDYEFLPGLTGRVNLGYDLLNRSESAYYPQETTLLGSEVGGAARRLNISNVTWMTDFLFSYNKTFGKHQISAVTGFTAQANTLDRTLAARYDFVTDAFGSTNLAGGALEVVPQSSEDKWSLVSWLGRVNYVLSERYLFTFSGRYDGSSRFGANNKFAFFPSGAIAWRLSNEPFLRDIEFVDNLKLRASYGVTGNQEIGLYRSLPRYITVGEVFDQTPAVGVRPGGNGIANEDLTWEETSQLDVGFDLTALKNRITFTFDYYKKTTKDLLLELPVALESGFSSVLQNSGSVENKGVELSTSTQLAVGKLGISLEGNFTYNNNRILDLGGQDTIIVGRIGEARIVGQDLSSLFIVDWVGVWQLDEAAEAEEFGRKPGDPKFVDQNNDGTYDLINDRTIVGVTQPTHFYGLNAGLTYQGFSLSVFFQGSAGNLARGTTRVGRFGGGSNAMVSSLDYWTPTNPSNRVVALDTQDPLLEGNVVQSSRSWEEADFVRLRNITLAYNLPLTALERIGFSKLRVYVSGQNLATFTNYSGQDPEGDGGNYPFAKNYRVGLNIGF